MHEPRVNGDPLSRSNNGAGGVQEAANTTESSGFKSPLLKSKQRSTSVGHWEAKAISLPQHVPVISHIAVDVRTPTPLPSDKPSLSMILFLPTNTIHAQIGGTLAKVAYYTCDAESTRPQPKLNFISFETRRVDDCMEFMLELKNAQQSLNGSAPGKLSVIATGGGAFKFYDKIRHTLSVDIQQRDEMQCLTTGELLPCLVGE
jgi:type II pantothenate kinase